MYLLRYLVHHGFAFLMQLPWLALLGATLLLFGISWGLLLIVEPADSAIIQPDTFWWFFVVTGTTVGYGDFTPVTSEGRVIVAIFNMFGGITLLGGFIGKLASDIGLLYQRSLKGLGSFRFMNNHIVIFGWQGDRTRRIIQAIRADTSECRDIVLCATQEIDNPVHELASYIQGPHLGAEDVLKRAGLVQANRIIIDCIDDDHTLAVSIAVAGKASPNAHIVAYFDTVEYAQLLQNLGRDVETIVDPSGDLLVRSMQDPGSSQIHEQMLSPLIGDNTQFSAIVPGHISHKIPYIDMLLALKKHYNATLLATAVEDQWANVEINGQADITAGTRIYFVGHQRIDPAQLDWSLLTSGA